MKPDLPRFVTSVLFLAIFLLAGAEARADSLLTGANSFFSFRFPAWLNMEQDPGNQDITFADDKEDIVIKLGKMVDGVDRQLGTEEYQAIQEEVVNKLSTDGFYLVRSGEFDFRETPGRKIELEGTADGRPVGVILIMIQNEDTLYLFGLFTRKKLLSQGEATFYEILNSLTFK